MKKDHGKGPECTHLGKIRLFLLISVPLPSRDWRHATQPWWCCGWANPLFLLLFVTSLPFLICCLPPPWEVSYFGLYSTCKLAVFSWIFPSWLWLNQINLLQLDELLYIHYQQEGWKRVTRKFSIHRLFLRHSHFSNVLLIKLNYLAQNLKILEKIMS